MQNSKVLGAFSVLYAADHSYTPFGMSLLTKLETSSYVLTAEPNSLAWVSELTTLRDLNITYVNIDSEVIKTLVCLSNLTKLVVTRFGFFADSPVINLNFSWCSLTAFVPVPKQLCDGTAHCQSFAFAAFDRNCIP